METNVPRNPENSKSVLEILSPKEICELEPIMEINVPRNPDNLKSIMEDTKCHIL